MSFHAATMASNRMQKLYSFLLAVKGKGATTMEINEACMSTRASSDISELNRNGHETVCRLDHVSENGRRVHRFWLKEYAPGDESSSSSVSSSKSEDQEQPSTTTTTRTRTMAEQPDLLTVDAATRLPDGLPSGAGVP